MARCIARQPRHSGHIVAALAAALLAGCTPPPDDLRVVAAWQTPPAGLPAGLPVRAEGPGTVSTPPPPEARSAVEVAARTAGGAAGYGLVGAIMGIQCGIGIIVCGPLGLVIGTGCALAEGAAAQQQDVATPEQVAAAAATLHRILEPSRLNACFGDTLVARASGRLGPDRPGPALHVWVQSVFIGVRAEGQSLVRGSNPPLTMTITVAASTDPPSQASTTEDSGKPSQLQPGTGRGAWAWTMDLPRYLVATANDGRVMQAEVETAIGVLAGHILADLYPGAVQRPPSRNGDAARAQRTACPQLAPQTTAGQTAAR